MVIICAYTTYYKDTRALHLIYHNIHLSEVNDFSSGYAIIGEQLAYTLKTHYYYYYYFYYYFFYYYFYYFYYFITIFIIFIIEMSWNMATEMCNRIGAYLPTPAPEREQEYLVHMIKPRLHYSFSTKGMYKNYNPLLYVFLGLHRKAVRFI